MLDGREWLDLLTTVKEFPSLVGLDKKATLRSSLFRKMYIN